MRKIYVFAGRLNNEFAGTIYYDYVRGHNLVSYEHNPEFIMKYPNLYLGADISPNSKFKRTRDGCHKLQRK